MIALNAHGANNGTHIAYNPEGKMHKNVTAKNYEALVNIIMMCLIGTGIVLSIILYQSNKQKRKIRKQNEE